MLTRRRLLTTAAPAAILLGLVACASAPSGDTISTDAGLIGAGLATVVAALQAAGVAVPQAALDAVNSAVADIQKYAAQISSAVGNTTGTLLQQIMGGLQTVATVLTPFFPFAQLAFNIVSAGVSLGSYLLSLVGVTSAAATKASAGLEHYSPPEARTILHVAAAS